MVGVPRVEFHVVPEVDGDAPVGLTQVVEPQARQVQHVPSAHPDVEWAGVLKFRNTAHHQAGYTQRWTFMSQEVRENNAINSALLRSFPSPSGAFHAIPDSEFYTTEYGRFVYSEARL